MMSKVVALMSMSLDGYAAVLIELREVGMRALKVALTDGWLACAPRDLAEQHASRLSR